MVTPKEEVINNLSQSLVISRKIIKVGSKVCIHTNAKGWVREYGWVTKIKDNEAFINYGARTNPFYGIGIWVKQSDLEIMEV